MSAMPPDLLRRLREAAEQLGTLCDDCETSKATGLFLGPKGQEPRTIVAVCTPCGKLRAEALASGVN